MSSTRKKPFLWLAKSPKNSKGKSEPVSLPSESTLKARSVLALPKDLSLLNSRGRTEEDKTRRRLGLPSHVPNDWPGFGDHHPQLLLDPQDHVTPEMLMSRGAPEEEHLLIGAGTSACPTACAWSEAGSSDDAQSPGDDARCDTTYSYVFPDRLCLHPEPISWAHPACDAEAASARHEPAFRPVSEDVVGAKRLPCDCEPVAAPPGFRAAQDRCMRSRAGASTHGGSLGSAAVFPELLPQQVLQFAELPLKPLPACVNSGAPTSPLGPLDHPWLSSGELESADRSGRPSSCSAREDIERIELLPGPGPALARQESAPAGAAAGQRGRSLLAGLSLPAGYEAVMQLAAITAPVPASSGPSPGAGQPVLQQAVPVPTPRPLEAAQAAGGSSPSPSDIAPGQAARRQRPQPAASHAGGVSSAFIAEEAQEQMIRQQVLCLVARAAGLLLVLLLTPMVIFGQLALRS